jgi:hypothetical protein
MSGYPNPNQANNSGLPGNEYNPNYNQQMAANDYYRQKDEPGELFTVFD